MGERLGVVFTGLSLGSILFCRAGPRDHLRPDGRHQHGARRADDDRRLRHLRSGAEPVPQFHLPARSTGLHHRGDPGRRSWRRRWSGAVLERTVIRWLYGRPLETLLATWGISLMLIQLVRTIFGAQNVPVENPSWLSGGVEVMSNLTLPYNRIAILVLRRFGPALASGAADQPTRLGPVRARRHAEPPHGRPAWASTPARIDTYAFALGAGIAGLAGCALSQVGNVGPDLGQGYIVDSFMVVVLGGVGQLAGTVVRRLGLACEQVPRRLDRRRARQDRGAGVHHRLHPARPQGIFALKGRAEA